MPTAVAARVPNLSGRFVLESHNGAPRSDGALRLRALGSMTGGGRESLGAGAPAAKNGTRNWSVRFSGGDDMYVGRLTLTGSLGGGGSDAGAPPMRLAGAVKALKGAAAKRRLSHHSHGGDGQQARVRGSEEVARMLEDMFRGTGAVLTVEEADKSRAGSAEQQQQQQQAAALGLAQSAGGVGSNKNNNNKVRNSNKLVAVKAFTLTSADGATTLRFVRLTNQRTRGHSRGSGAASNNTPHGGPSDGGDRRSSILAPERRRMAPLAKRDGEA